MTYYVSGYIGSNKYKIEARRDGLSSELMGIYDGYYNSRYHTFSLYRKILGGSAQPWDVPEKLRISAYDVKKVTARRKNEAVCLRSAPADADKSARRGKEQDKAESRKRMPRDVDGQLKIF